MAEARLHAAFLSRSSTIAAERGSRALQMFAAGETPVEEAFGAALATPEPVRVADDGFVATGRSAAAVPPAEEAGSTGVPAAALALRHLAASEGVAFDGLYKATQIAALRRMIALCSAYSAAGDEAPLRALAGAELASARARVAELSGR